MNDKNTAILNPVHEFEGVWYFWDETGTKRIGSYVSEIGAIKGLEDYLVELEEKRTGKYGEVDRAKIAKEIEIVERRSGEDRRKADRRETNGHN